MTQGEAKGGGGSQSGTGGGTKTGMGIGGGAYALLVGVGRYKNDLWSIPVAARDVDAMQKVLVDGDSCEYPKDQVRALKNQDATRDNILSRLKWLEKQVINQTETTVLVYFSGHGWTEGDHHYLVPHETDPYDIQGTALPASEFIDALRRIRPTRLLVVLDTCHAEHMAEAKGAAGQPSLPPGFVVRPLEEGLAEALLGAADSEAQSSAPSGSKSAQDDRSEWGRGRAVFTSCTGRQKSWFVPDAELSIFTQHLIEALKGQGTPENETFVHVSGLMDWVSKHVVTSAEAIGREQKPVYKHEGMNFVVARVRGAESKRPSEESRDDRNDLRTPARLSVTGGRDAKVATFGNVEGDITFSQ